MNTESNPRIIDEILDLARWAPSADNTQVWEFEVVDDRRVLVHCGYIGDDCVYDLGGHASEMAHGALLETLSIAASGHGLETKISKHESSRPDNPVYDVTLSPSKGVEPSPLIPNIKQRSVQRRKLKTRRLSTSEKSQLEEALPEDYEVIWLEMPAQRLKMALLMFRFAHIRLTMKEAYEVHKKIIEWDSQYSVDRIPDQALGIDPLLVRIMRWAMVSWDRIAVLNRFAAGTWLPRMEMDLIPGFACAAHFAITKKTLSGEPIDPVDSGRTMQRFWLTATRLGIQLQPEMTPLVFRSYVQKNIRFTTNDTAQRKAAILSRQLEDLLGKENAANAVVLGRLGDGNQPKSRSLRKSMQELLFKTP